MSKLTALYFKLDLSQIQVSATTSSYVAFRDVQSGEPHTVIEYEDQLIVSGNKPQGPIHRFDTVSDCLDYILN